MKPFYLLCLACLGLCLSAQALTKGMTMDAVKTELGKPVSHMELGNRTVWIYAGQRKLEFESGKLVRENDLELKSTKAPTQSLLGDSSQPELKIEIPVARNDQTITESYQVEELSTDDIGANYNFSAISEDLTEAIENYEDSQGSTAANDARDHIRNVLIGFILEVVITVIVLQIAFSLSGFPSLFRQIILLSLAVALAGAMLDYMLHVGVLNPVRSGVGFLILLVLIRQMTDVREWATAIRIALLARLISIGLMWLAFAGIMVLFGL